MLFELHRDNASGSYGEPGLEVLKFTPIGFVGVFVPLGEKGLIACYFYITKPALIALC